MSDLLENISNEISHNLANHIEEFASAFLKRTGLDPTKVKLVSGFKNGPQARYEVWFEPFPTESEIESYRLRAEKAEEELEEERKKNQWISLKEKKPHNSGYYEVIIIPENGKKFLSWAFYATVYGGFIECLGTVTHYRPMLDFPAEEESI